MKLRLSDGWRIPRVILGRLAGRLRQGNSRSVGSAGLVLAGFALAGSVYLVLRHAAGSAVSLEAENGSVAGAPIVADSSASGGLAVQFAAATVTPQSPPPSGPGSALSGVFDSTTDVSTIDSFGTWRGTPVDLLHSYPARDSWTAIENPYSVAAVAGTKYTGSHLFLSVGLWPVVNNVPQGNWAAAAAA